MSVEDRTPAPPEITAVQIDEVEVRLAGRVACPWCAELSRPGPSCDTCGSPLDEQEAARLTEEFRETLEARIKQASRAEREAKKLEEQARREETERKRQEAEIRRTEEHERKRREAEALAAEFRRRAEASGRRCPNPPPGRRRSPRGPRRPAHRRPAGRRRPAAEETKRPTTRTCWTTSRHPSWTAC